MTRTEKFVEILTKGKRCFYHFTDTRNLVSIREHGLLSMRSIRSRDIVVAPGGNDWSLDADRRSGMDGFVHLCFFCEHPMEYIATREGRIQKSKFLKVAPEVLLTQGTLITQMVSNKSGAVARPVEEMIEILDLEVIYTRTDWKDPKIQARLKAARLCEILVPTHISTKHIRGIE